MKKKILLLTGLLSVSILTSCDNGFYSVEVFLPNGQAVSNVSVEWKSTNYLMSPIQTDKNGKAEIDLEDGNYTIKLSNLPTNYTYQPGKYEASVNNKRLKITLSEILNHSSGNGSNYDPYIINEGVYAVEANNENVYYGFMPTKPGKYLVESWIDESENFKANVGFYGNNSAYIPDTPIEQGESTTNNFKYTLKIAQDEFVKTGELDENKEPIYARDENNNLIPGGPYSLGIKTNSNSKQKFNFSISYIGEYFKDKIICEDMFPQEELSIYPNKKLDDVYKEMPLNGTIEAFYNEEDGYYHAKDKNGPILVAKISEPCPYIEAPFSKTNPETGANEGVISASDLVLDNGRKNYTEFIKEYEKYCNEDGVYGVNKEIKDFLGYYYLYLYEWLNGIPNLIIAEGCGWMFACGFYTDIADSYTQPYDGEGSQESPYNIGLDTYYAKTKDGKTLYYSYYAKNVMNEETYFVRSRNPNAIFTYNDKTYSSETGAYFEVVLGGTANPSGFIFQVASTSNEEIGIEFEVAIKENIVEGDAISIGKNTVTVIESGSEICSMPITQKGIYTITCEEENALIEDDELNTYNGASGKIEFSKEYNEGDTLTFTIFTNNFKEDNITFTITLSPIAKLGINQANVVDGETVIFKFISPEIATYRVFSEDPFIFLGIQQGNVDNYESNSYDLVAKKVGQEFTILVSTSDWGTHTVRFNIQKVN